MASPSRSPNWFSKLVRSSRSESKSPPGASTDARARRREQVRRAQRTHRDRKANYVKALEVEVARLRSREVAHEMDVRKFMDIVRRLRDILFFNSIEVPEDLDSVEYISPEATIEVYGGVDQSQHIRARMPDTETTATFSQVSPPSSTPGKIHRKASSNIQGSSAFAYDMSSQSPPSDNSGLQVHPYGLDRSQIGVDFVLTLEHPCLLHHDPNAVHPELGEGTGHSLMLQAPIMARVPQTTSDGGSLSSGTTWNVPAMELERLLGFSERLTLDDEITPVQAWQHIRTHRNFQLLTPDQLDAIAAALAAEVKCYGFGAVIDEVYFNQVLEQTFAASPRNR